MFSLLDGLVCGFISAVNLLIIATVFLAMIYGEGHARWLALCFFLTVALSVIAGGVGKFMAKYDELS